MYRIEAAVMTALLIVYAAAQKPVKSAVCVPSQQQMYKEILRQLKLKIATRQTKEFLKCTLNVLEFSLQSNKKERAVLMGMNFRILEMLEHMKNLSDNYNRNRIKLLNYAKVNAELEMQLENKVKEVNKLADVNAYLQKELQNKTIEVNKLEEKNANLKIELQNKSRQIFNLTKENAELEMKLENKLKEVNELEENNVDLQIELQNKERQIDDLETNVTKSQNKIKELDEEVKDLNETVNFLYEALGCRLPGGRKITKQVQEFIITKEWTDLRKILEDTLDHRNVAYHQLQKMWNSYEKVLWRVGQRGYKELAEVLVYCGGAINVRDKNGDSMLHGVAVGGDVKMTEWLLCHGAHINALGSDNRTPLAVAATEGELSVVKCLVEAGANISATDKNGQTALDLATSGGYTDIKEYLIQQMV